MLGGVPRRPTRSGSDSEAVRRLVMASCSFPLAAIVGEEEEAGERKKVDTAHETCNKGADRQETSKTDLMEGTAT